MHNSFPRDLSELAKHLRKIVTHKLRRWKFKKSLPLIHTLESLRDSILWWLWFILFCLRLLLFLLNVSFDSCFQDGLFGLWCLQGVYEGLLTTWALLKLGCSPLVPWVVLLNLRFWMFGFVAITPSTASFWCCWGLVKFNSFYISTHVGSYCPLAEPLILLGLVWSFIMVS